VYSNLNLIDTFHCYDSSKLESWSTFFQGYLQGHRLVLQILVSEGTPLVAHIGRPAMKMVMKLHTCTTYVPLGMRFLVVVLEARLPYFSWYLQCTKMDINIPTDHKIYQMALKYTNNFCFTGLQNIYTRIGIFGM
jgi:hypothetical protein